MVERSIESNPLRFSQTVARPSEAAAVPGLGWPSALLQSVCWCCLRHSGGRHLRSSVSELLIDWRINQSIRCVSKAAHSASAPPLSNPQFPVLLTRSCKQSIHAAARLKAIAQQKLLAGRLNTIARRKQAGAKTKVHEGLLLQHERAGRQHIQKQQLAKGRCSMLMQARPIGQKSDRDTQYACANVRTCVHLLMCVCA